jgi:hypothetical protein
VPDLTQPGTPIDREKLRSLQVKGDVTKGRSRTATLEDGTRVKITRDENNATIREHSKPGSGVSHRQDVNVRPEMVELKEL